MTSPEYVVLERGAACLPCKRRKKRCDAARPVCGPCIRADTTGSCQYTQKQASKVASPPRKSERLKTQVRDLEDQVATLERQASASVSSSQGSSEPRVESVAGSDIMEMEITTPTSVTSPGRSSSSYPSHDMQSQLSGHSVASKPVPDWREELLKIFLEHRHQCAFEVHETRFAESFRSSFGSTGTSSTSSPHTRQMHPALMNAVFLMACHFASRLPLSAQWEQHEPYFLAQTQDCLATSLAHADRLADFVQATSLLVRYFFYKGRTIEAQYHVSGLACFSVGLNLNVLTLPGGGPGATARVAAPSLASPADPIEQDERISLFWSIFLLDRTSSLVCGLPVAIPSASVALPWARGWEVYGTARNPTPSNEPTLAEWMHLPSPHFASPADLDSTLSLRVIGATIFERAVRLVKTSHNGHSYEAVLRERAQLIESIDRISDWLPSFPFDLGGSSSSQQSFFVHPSMTSFEYRHDFRDYDLDAHLNFPEGNSYSPHLHAEPASYSPFEHHYDHHDSHVSGTSLGLTTNFTSSSAASSSSSSSGNSIYGDCYSTPPPQPSLFLSTGYSSPPPLQGSYSPASPPPAITPASLAALLFVHSAIQSARIYLDRVFVPITSPRSASLHDYGQYSWENPSGLGGGRTGRGGARDAALQIAEMARWALSREVEVGSFFCELEMLIGMCWTAAYEVLIESSPSSNFYADADNEIPRNILTRALDTLSHFIPLTRAMAASVGSTMTTNA